MASTVTEFLDVLRNPLTTLASSINLTSSSARCAVDIGSPRLSSSLPRLVKIVS